MRTLHGGRALTVARASLGACALLTAGCLTKEPPHQQFFDQHIAARASVDVDRHDLRLTFAAQLRDCAKPARTRLNVCTFTVFSPFSVRMLSTSAHVHR